MFTTKMCNLISLKYIGYFASTIQMFISSIDLLLNINYKNPGTLIHNLRKNNCGILWSQVRKSSYLKLLGFIVCLKNQIWAVSNRKHILIKLLFIRFFCFKIRLIPSSCIMNFILKIRIELCVIFILWIIRNKFFDKKLVFVIKMLKNLFWGNTPFQQSVLVDSYSCWSFEPSWDG